jgi:hypothetical protein
MDCFATLAMTTKVTEFRFEKFRLRERSEAIHVVCFELFVVLYCFATLAMTTGLRLREKRSATKRRSDLPAGRQVHVVRAGRLREAKPKRPACRQAGPRPLISDKQFMMDCFATLAMTTKVTNFF